MVDKKVEEKIEQLQALENNLQHLTMQKKTLQSQLIEITNALEELGKKPKQVFKLVGPVMIEGDIKNLEKDLNEKKEIIEVKLKNVEKQEEKLKETLQKTQSEVLEDIKKNE